MAALLYFDIKVRFYCLQFNVNSGSTFTMIRCVDQRYMAFDESWTFIGTSGWRSCSYKNWFFSSILTIWYSHEIFWSNVMVLYGNARPFATEIWRLSLMAKLSDEKSRKCMQDCFDKFLLIWYNLYLQIIHSMNRAVSVSAIIDSYFVLEIRTWTCL